MPYDGDQLLVADDDALFMKRYHFLQAFFVELHDDHPVSFYE
jgi:hypothetical protein